MTPDTHAKILKAFEERALLLGYDTRRFYMLIEKTTGRKFYIHNRTEHAFQEFRAGYLTCIEDIKRSTED